MEQYPNRCPIAVIIDCDYMKGQPLSYAGFIIIPIIDDDDPSELKRFYSGNPEEDYEDIRFYAFSIAQKVFHSANIDAFIKESGIDIHLNA